MGFQPPPLGRPKVDFYLGRSRINYNNALPSRWEIKTGAPHGSILGPLLFLLYINDISNSSDIIRSILCADDTNNFHCCESIEELCDIVNIELQGVMQWFKANRLSVNLKKKKFCDFWQLCKIEETH